MPATNVISFARYKFPNAPHTLEDRIEHNRLEILEFEAMLSDINRKYERALYMWDAFAAVALKQNGEHIRTALNDAYFTRDCLLDEAGR